MSGRAAVRIELEQAERAELETRARRRKSFRADAIRAEIVLLAATGLPNLVIAKLGRKTGLYMIDRKLMKPNIATPLRLAVILIVAQHTSGFQGQRCIEDSRCWT